MDKQKTILKYQIISIIFVLLLGTLLHFTYEWSGRNIIVGLFSAINESTWEHLKLVFFPMLISTIIGYFLVGESVPNYWCAKVIGLLSSMAFIVISFYTLNGITGVSYGFINIALFFFGIMLGEYIAYKIIMSKFNCNYKIAIITLVILTILFVFFTYFTPKIGIFKNPLAFL